MRLKLARAFTSLSKVLENKVVVKLRELEYVTFIIEFIQSPRTIGAVCPCSKKLASQIAEEVISAKNEFVIEIGAGTGCITESLLAKGIQPHKLILVERSPALVAYLKNKFPNVIVIEGDAANLMHILPKEVIPNIGCVVSSLPLLSLPEKTVRQVIEQIQTLLGNNGFFIQYTYGITKKTMPFCENFDTTIFKIIWLNIPPACIMKFSVNDTLRH